jgi:cytochrome c6
MLTKYLVLILLLFSKQTNTLENGKELFIKNCNICHKNKQNKILPEKNLKKEILELYGINKLESIKYQIRNGKNGMPAFGLRLNEKEIEKIAKYVLETNE